MPPVQNIAIFLFFILALSFNKLFETHSGNSLKFFIFGLTAFSKLPIDTSYSFLVSIKSTFLSSINSFQSSGFT